MTEYELSRRDAIAALTASGVAVTAGGVLSWDYLTDEDLTDDGGFSDHERETVLAVAETVYPSAVEGIAEFVETYVVGRIEDEPERLDGVAAAIESLDEYADRHHETSFVELDATVRDELLQRMGVDVVDSDPIGSDVERVRYYLVNELLYALYTSPTGGKLVGIENPQGHPGGTESYRRGPE